LNDKEPKGSFLLRLGRFIGERSFYFILLLCVLVIGGTAWIFSAAMDSTKPVEPSLQTRPSTPPRTPDPGAVYTWMPEIVPPRQASPEPTEAPAEEPENGAEAAELPPEEAAEVIATAFGWPIKGEICSGYSVDRLQYDRTMQDWRTHSAIDIEAELGEKVLAAGDGIVERIYTDQMYGVTVVLYHGAGLRSIYCNLAGTPTVQTGDTVSLGQVIGAVGDTADAENGDVNHLHFAMTLDETRVDPLTFLPER
jgi:murein DD-endopeptidase MepM/ murein hydrolase activator NlpD